MSGPRRRERFFLIAAVIPLAFVLIGFTTSLYLRPFFDEPHDALRNILLDAGAPAPKSPLPLYLYIHGAAATAWFVLVVVQTTLVAASRTNLHRRLGIAGVGLAVLVIATNLLATIGLPDRARQAGVPDSPIVAQLLLANSVGITVFALLVGAAIAFRRRREAHRRLMLFATIGMIPPAAARLAGVLFSAGVPPAIANMAPFISLVALAGSVLVYDLKTRRRPHLATVVGLFVLFVLPAIVLAIAS